MAENPAHPDSESSSDAASPPETTRARRVRRRAGAPAGAPATSSAPSDAESVGAPARRTTVAAQQADPAEATEPTRPTRRRRRAGAPAGAPAEKPAEKTPAAEEPQTALDLAATDDETASETSEQEAVETTEAVQDAEDAAAPATQEPAEGDSEEDGEQAEAKSEDSDEDDSDAETEQTEDEKQEGSGSGRRSRRSRSRRSASRRASAPEDTSPTDEDGSRRKTSDAAEDSAADASDRDTAAEQGEDSTIAQDLKDLADSHPRREDDEDEKARRVQAQFDLTSLLFQAPTPTRSRTTVGTETAPGGSAEIAFDAGSAPERPADEDGDEDDDVDSTDEGTDEKRDGSSDDDEGKGGSRRRRRRGGRGRRGRGRGDDDRSDKQNDGGEDSSDDDSDNDDSSGGRDGSDDSDSNDSGSSSSRRRRRRRRSGSSDSDASSPDDPPNTVVKVREGRDEVKAVKGSTRLEAKKQRRREGRDAGRRRQVITEAEFLARRESVKRSMVVREHPGRTQIAVLEDDVLVEHYVAQKTQTSMVGNVYLGKVQNVLPSMEAAFIDIGRGRNAVLYAGEVNWDAAGLDGQPRRIELALKSGDSVLVQVTKDPIGHKGARLTSQVSLPGRYVVFVPGGSMTGISRKLPDTERSRLKKIMKAIIPEEAGVIVRTAAEGASEEELTRDVERLRAQWAKIEKAQKAKSAPAALSQEPDLAIKVVRDVFNEDFTSLIVEGQKTYDDVHEYVSSVAPDLLERVTRHVGEKDAFAKHRIDEQLLKAMDRKVYLPSGGSLVIDRTEAMTVVDVNTGKFTGSGGSLEETVTRNNLEAAEEIVRQLRLRDIGGIIVIDFIDMVLESNRDLVLRRLVECLGRDRTKHQVAEVTSLGLVQMTRKRVGQGLVETFSNSCEHCNGRGLVVDLDGETSSGDNGGGSGDDGNGRSSKRRGRKSRGGGSNGSQDNGGENADAKGSDVHRLQEDEGSRALARATIASIAAASTQQSHPEVVVDGQVITVGDADAEQAEGAEVAGADGAPAQSVKPESDKPETAAADSPETAVSEAADQAPGSNGAAPSESTSSPQENPAPEQPETAQSPEGEEDDASQ